MTWRCRLTPEIGQIAGELPVDKSGWQRLDVWAGNQMCGDEALMEYTATYGRGAERLEVTYYVRTTPWGVDPDEATEWGVDQMAHTFRVDADGELVEDGFEDYSYEGGWPYTLDSFDKARQVARLMALEDEAWKLGPPVDRTTAAP